jgi:hypothetical protein
VITGIQWGIFIALFAACWLAYTGVALRRAHRSEPRLADDPTVHLRGLRTRDKAGVATAGPAPVRPRGHDLLPSDDPPREHRGVTREDAEQLSFELPGDPDDR